jgi:hypothetical protein
MHSLDNGIAPKTVATKIFNNSIKEKMISRQEATVLLMAMPLFLCSEIIESVNLSGSYRLDSTTSSYTSRFYNKYAKRNTELFHNTTLDEFFHMTKNINISKTYIPHYVGGKVHAVWPPTQEFARAMLVVHRPWHGQFCIPNENFIHEFNKLYYSHGCPYKLKTTVQREIFRLTSGSKY